MARAMVGAALHKVNKNRHLPLYRCHCIRQTDSSNPLGNGIVVYLLLFGLAAALALLLAWLRERRFRQREDVIRAMLDGADALEAQLQECRQRMQTLKGMLVVLPEEMSERANVALSADDKVGAALKDLLAHRLWIKQNAETATLSQLDAARAALAQSGATLQAQLDRLAAIASDLQRAQANAQSITPPSA